MMYPCSLCFRFSYRDLLVRDCQFWNGGNELTGVEGSVAALHNNLFVRSGLGAFADASSTLTLFNNLVRNTEVLLLNQDNANLWRIHNNAFDHCAVSSLFTPLTNSHNAYINCDGRLTPTNVHDVVLGSFNYATGPLGDYYHATANLRNVGSTDAYSAGLFHYTTSASQVMETNSVVDIGFHYMCLTNGVVPDSDADGIPDYLDADSDGNDGLPDWWEHKHMGHLAETPDGDYDGDCVTNLLEYLQGTNPAELPSVASYPVYQMVTIGANVTFSVSGNPGCVKYQWYKNNELIPGATNTSLTLNAVQLASNALYRADVYSGAGVAPAAARLVVLDAPAWTIWTNYIAHTNNQSINLWTTPQPPYSLSPGQPPTFTWNTNCLLYGMTGFTALSPFNEWGGMDGGVTALTKRHGYMRGHGQGICGLRTNHYAGKKVWFYAADNTPVVMTVAADYIRNPFECAGYDYGLVIFTSDLPDSIVPLAVMTAPSSIGVCFRTCQHGAMSACMPPFDFLLDASKPPFNEHHTRITGDSGRPDMIPMPDGFLLLIGGRTTSGPSAQMQADMNALSLYLNLNTNIYQLNWNTNYP